MITKLNAKNFYNIIAKEYVKTYTKHSRAEVILKKYEKLLPQKSKILDIGCGPGFPIGKFLAKRKHKITGIDISKEMVRYAKKFVKKGKFVVSDIRTIKLPENRYNGIVASFSLVHMPKKDVKKSLKKIYNLLKVGGILFLSVVKDEGEKVMTWFGKTTKCTYFKEKEIKSILQDIGFKIIHLEKYSLIRRDKKPQIQIFIFAKRVKR